MLNDTQTTNKKNLTIASAIFTALIALSFSVYAASVLWDTNSDFMTGTFNNTINISGNLTLNESEGNYYLSGYYISSPITTTYPIKEVTPLWYSQEENENVNITIEISANSGTSWCLAQNETELNSTSCPKAGFETDTTLIFRANLSTNDTQITPYLESITLSYEELIPYMELNFTTPYDNTIVGYNKTFIANITIYCRDGDCGDVNATIYYNSTGLEPDTPVSENGYDTPLYIIGGMNAKNCTGNPLSNGEHCNITWQINATGELSSAYELEIIVESNRTQSNTSIQKTIEIGKMQIINMEFTKIEFGLLDPGDSDEPATNNAIGYNITIDTNSNDVENLWIKGTNLTHDDSESLNCNPQKQYNPYDTNTTNYPCTINVSGISWAESESPLPDNLYPLTGEYSRINKDLSILKSGTSKPLFFWINVPYGVYAGQYTGTITFMANTTW